MGFSLRQPCFLQCAEIHETVGGDNLSYPICSNRGNQALLAPKGPHGDPLGSQDFGFLVSSQFGSNIGLFEFLNRPTMLIRTLPTFWAERIEFLEFRTFAILGTRVLRALSTLFRFRPIIFEVSGISTNGHPDDFSGLRSGFCSPS